MSTSRKGKRVAVVTVAVTVMVLGVAGYVFRDSLVEQYWLYRLQHGDEEAKKVAAVKLGERRSVRAVVPLIELMMRFPPKIDLTQIFTNDDIGPELQRAQAERWKTNWPGQALVRVGTASLKPLFKHLLRLELATRSSERELHTPETEADILVRERQRLALRETIVTLGEQASPFLEVASRDTDVDVRVLANPLLRTINGEAPPSDPALTRVLSILEGGDHVLLGAGEDAGLFVGEMLIVFTPDPENVLGGLQVISTKQGESIARINHLNFGDTITMGNMAARWIDSTVWEQARRTHGHADQR